MTIWLVLFFLGLFGLAHISLRYLKNSMVTETKPLEKKLLKLEQQPFVEQKNNT